MDYSCIGEMILPVFTTTETSLFAHLDDCNIFSLMESRLLVLVLEEKSSICNLLLQLANKRQAGRRTVHPSRQSNGYEDSKTSKHVLCNW